MDATIAAVLESCDGSRVEKHGLKPPPGARPSARKDR
jgi:hypothetical protein